MSLRRQFSEEEVTQIGRRLKSCRVLTGLTQEQFAEKCDFPYTTIRNWEFGRVVPRVQGVSEFIASLRSFNIFVDGDWILFGNGVGPSFNLKQPNTEATSFEIETFKTNSKTNGLNPIIVTVTDDKMSPWFCAGDIVCGTLIDADELKEVIDSKLNRGLYPVLVRMHQGHYSPRWPKMISDRLVFASFDPVIEELSPISVALIRWHEVKYPRS